MQNTSYNVKEICVSIWWVNFYFRVFYRASLWLWQFLWGDYRLEVFAPSSLCVWSQMPWRNLQIRVLLWGFLNEFLLRFNKLSESVMLWNGLFESHFDSSSEFSQFLVWCGGVEEHYNLKTIERWTKGCILPFPKKGDHEIAMNYRGITLTSIVAKIYIHIYVCETGN